MFLVVMVSAVQCISLDKVRDYGMAMFILCLFMCSLICSLSVGMVRNFFVGNINFRCAYLAFLR